MNRLTYWLKAKTQYNIHSPFVFDLYNEVLFSRLDPHVTKLLDGSESLRFRELLYKLEHSFFPVSVERDRGVATLMLTDEVIVVVDRPHASRQSELDWDRLKSEECYRVSIDLFDVGLLFSDKRLHRQHFLLR